MYVPLTIGMLHLPPAYSLGDPSKLSRRSAYWAHRYVENLANLRWRDMIRDIRAARQEAMRRSVALMEEVCYYQSPMPPVKEPYTPRKETYTPRNETYTPPKRALYPPKRALYPPPPKRDLLC